jgi:creatinine amidohydrolase
MNATRFLVFALTLGISLLATASQAQTQSTNAPAQPLPCEYEKLSSPKFLQALEKSAYTCVIPFGIMEKHGPHLPLGTDLMQVREMCLRAAKQEYAIVFPPYYFGQINEAKHQPGTIAYSSELIWKLLQETLNELARNGVKKIVIVNGHGGNNDFLRFFNMAQLEKPHAYSLFLVDPWNAEIYAAVQPKLKSTIPGGHADETETSMIMAIHPELVNLEEGKLESGADQGRLSHFKNISTPLDWYAGYPNHYSGQGFNGSVELGEFQYELHSKLVADAIKQIKADKNVQELQQEFFKCSTAPAKAKTDKVSE